MKPFWLKATWHRVNIPGISHGYAVYQEGLSRDLILVYGGDDVIRRMPDWVSVREVEAAMDDHLDRRFTEAEKLDDIVGEVEV